MVRKRGCSPLRYEGYQSKVKSDLITLTEDIEIARHDWLRQPDQKALWRCHFALTSLCRSLHTLEDPSAVVHEKRWKKIADDLEPLLHCYNLTIRLQINAPPELLNKLASALSALTLGPEATVKKRFDSEKWRRLRGWWREFIDAIEPDQLHRYSDSSLPKAVHRLFKYRDRAFKDSSLKPWHKLRTASLALEEQLSNADTAATEDFRGLLAACQLLNDCLEQWHWLQAQLPLIKALRKSPQLQGGSKAITLLDDQLDQVNAECHVLLERCRETLAELDGKV